MGSLRGSAWLALHLGEDLLLPLHLLVHLLLHLLLLLLLLQGEKN